MRDWCPAQYLSRSGFLYSLPVGRRGSASVKSTVLGHLSLARCWRQKAISSASSSGPGCTPAIGCTTALTASPISSSGTLWFKSGSPFEYFNDPEKTKETRSPDGSMSTVGDVGYVDDDGYLYLTDRATFMIISGGVNIYPQECENLLITHPKVADAAVFGVPNADLGEEVKAVVQPMPGVEIGPEFEKELIDFCGQHLSRQKVPRSIDFAEELPRLPTGKLYKRLLRDRYWGDKKSRIV